MEYICPKCGGKLEFKYRPQYHNEYFDIRFECAQCDFVTEKLYSYKHLMDTKQDLVNKYNIKQK